MPPCDILIIDDDQDDLEILAEAFTQSGVQCVHYVHTAMQAFMYLESVKNDLPKLIVMDYYLAGITGPEFLKDLKQMELYKTVPVIILSTSKTPLEIERYKSLGILEFIEKPNTYEDYLTVAATLTAKLQDNNPTQ